MKHVLKPKKSPFIEFFPLIIVMLTILLAVGITESWLGRFELMEAMRFFMGYFFLLFGAFKVIDWNGFVDAYAGYDIITKRIRAYGYLYPVLELTLAVLYLGGFFLVWTNVATIVLMAVSSIGVIQAVTGKKKIHCACLGAVVKLPMTTVTIIEDVGMGLMALVMLVWQFV